MAHRDLLPTASDLRGDLAGRGLTEEQASSALRCMAHLLRMHADYYDDEYQKFGEKDDQGAAAALSDLVLDLDSA